ncbi:recombinase family protein [Fastidiosibacter lacustris]|uniref:recombinase family protein n=1 Tax=Fastidiosibacter lacustris TaxID=2056695 RepID=UPI000E34CE53
MSLIGYARVSTKEQSLDIQIEKLQAYGCQKIYQEKVSGVDVYKFRLDLTVACFSNAVFVRYG